MRQSKWLMILLPAFALLMMQLCCCMPGDISYSNPPPTFQDTDLVGVWEAHYGIGIDNLTIRADGTFKQVYRDYTVEGYVYETSWNKWWVERFSDGRVWVHLQGARYYLDGIMMAELDGKDYPGPEDQPDFWGKTGPPPFPFYDPFGKRPLYMVGELVLNVRCDSSGEIILHHMWTSSDRGFAIIGGDVEVFRRVETTPLSH